MRQEISKTLSATIEEPGGQSLICTSCFSVLSWLRKKDRDQYRRLISKKNIVLSDWNSCIKGNLFSLLNLARTLLNKLFLSRISSRISYCNKGV